MSISKNKHQSFGFFANLNRMNKTSGSEKSIFRFDIGSILKRTAIQAVLCAVLFVVLITINAINTGVTNKITDELAHRLNQEFMYKESYNTIMGWGNSLIVKGEEALEALNFTEWSQRQFVLPMKGEIINYFKETDDTTGKVVNGILIQTIEEEKVIASDEGVIIEVGASQGLGHYVIIKHRGEYITAYKHMESIDVEVNKKVARGEKIGVSSDRLIFEIWQRQEAVDPLIYIDIDQINI